MDEAACKRKMDMFCYVCGRFTIIKSRKGISAQLEQIYRQYYRMAVIRDVWWAPQFMCSSCYGWLYNWRRQKIDSMPFGVPMIWSKPDGHHADNCYACANDTYGLNRHTRSAFIYKSVYSAVRPVPHDEYLPVPERLEPLEWIAEEREKRTIETIAHHFLNVFFFN